jgi:hypothetical protein
VLTAQQAYLEVLHSEAAGRTAQAADLVEVSLLMQLYPYRNGTVLAAWHAALATSSPAFMARRVQLARTLLSMARSGVSEGPKHLDINAIAAAYQAACTASALLAGMPEPASGGGGPAHPPLDEARHEAAALAHELPLQAVTVLTKMAKEALLIALGEPRPPRCCGGGCVRSVVRQGRARRQRNRSAANFTAPASWRSPALLRPARAQRCGPPAGATWTACPPCASWSTSSACRCASTLSPATWPRPRAATRPTTRSRAP